MNKKVLGIIVVLMAAALLSISLPFACATKPMDVNFKRMMTSTSIEGRRAGKSDNVILNIAATHLFTGDIAGTGAADARWIFHNFPFGPVNVHVVETLSSVTVMGDPKSGTLTIRLDFIRDPTDTIEGTWVIISGTDELANLHGQGTVFGPLGDASYSGQVHFDP